ncbi:hypothetical protein I4F81_001318 [Pyropia yezoensis]|uniref:Uncharacterized protein n=1 Tax=Pyropia yezoensis TaxID=2788 RepID=A0ACC3BMI9_PYRYE|nr:hypothetical protein I4F81_001318 [Neopyropia yezoensis]
MSSPLDFVARPLYPAAADGMARTSSQAPLVTATPPRADGSAHSVRGSAASATPAPGASVAPAGSGPKTRSRRPPIARKVMAPPVDALASVHPTSSEARGAFLGGGGAPPVQPTAAVSTSARTTTQAVEIDHVAANVSALAASCEDVKRELSIVSDAVSGASAKLETHAKTLETYGSIVSGLTNSVTKLTSVVTSQLPSPSWREDGVDPHGAAKVPRVGFAADAKHASKYLEVKIEDGQANDRVVGMHHMIAIRRKLNDRLTDSVGTALTCGGVYQDSATFSTLVSECTMEHFGCSEEEARVFLESDINQPTKQRGGGSKARSSSSSSEYASGSKQKKAEPTIVHAGSLLLAVQPHLVEAIKKKVIAAFFVAVGLQISTVTLIQVLQWLAKNKYTASDVGHKAVRAGVKAMFAYLGVSDRELDDDVGSRTVLNISIGHYALASCFIQHCMELAVAKAYKKRTRRTGAEPGLYLLWRLELLRGVVVAAAVGVMSGNEWALSEAAAGAVNVDVWADLAAAVGVAEKRG